MSTKKATKLRTILNKLNVIKDKNENSELLNLIKTPMKEPKKHTPSIKVGKANVVNQADLLYLPDDNGYKYLLVVGDVATHKIDCEPLKTRDSITVRDALKKIYARKIIKRPLTLEVDDGSEFKLAFKHYWSKVLKIVTKMAGRHRSQAFIETKNGQIGEVLNASMLSDEINNDATSKKWVHLVKDLVKLLNEEYVKEPKITPTDAPEITNKFTADLIPEGTRVRYQLDNPEDYVSGSRLHGRFRKSDVRWSRTIHKVDQISLRPNQPPMYILSDMPVKVGYTKYQLQIVKDDETRPIQPDGAQQYAQRVTNKKKIKGKIYYEVEWEDKSRTEQPRTQLIKEIPDLIKEYENSQEKK